MRKGLILFALALAITGCAQQQKTETTTPAPSTAQAPAVKIEDRDWDLVMVGEMQNPQGNGGRPATLRLDTATQRAAGNSGCNRYSGTYRLSGDSLSFGPAISTKMACEQGMDLETAWLGALAKIVTFSATESTLTLNGAEGPVARLAEHRAP
jgi:heat shock protein HslJ